MAKTVTDSHIKKLMDVFPKLDYGLTERQWMLLSTIAIKDDTTCHFETLKSELKNLYRGAGKGHLSTDLDLLEEKGYIAQRYSWGSRDYYVSKHCFMQVALNALLYYQENKFYRSYENSSRLSMVVYIYTDDKRHLSALLKDDKFPFRQFIPELMSIMHEEAFADIFKYMDQLYLIRLLRVYLNNSESNCLLCHELINNCITFIEKFIDENSKPALKIEINVYRWIVDGVWRLTREEEKAGNSMAYYALGIRELYKGNYPEAIKFMESAPKCRKLDPSFKSLVSPLFTYFLTCAYALSGEATHTSKLNLFLNRSLIENQLGAAIFVAKKATGYDGAHFLDYVNGPSAMQENLCLISGIDKKFETHFLKDTPPVPTTAILKHETGIGLDEEEADILEERFGGTSILSRLDFKQPWEFELQEIDKIISERTETKPIDKDNQRLIYIVDKDGALTIKYQRILKNGKWSTGCITYPCSLCSETYENFGDEADKKVIEKLKIKQVANAAYLFPALIGCNRVFHDNCDEANKVSIVEEIPYLSLKKDEKNNKFIFSTNVPRTRYFNEFLRESVIKNSTRKYTVIRLNAAQQQLLQYIFSKSTEYPAAAETALEKMIPRLEKIIELHSEYFSSASALEEKQGDAGLIIRIVPKPGAFVLTLHVRPLKGGTLTCAPGNGDAIVFDSAEGKRCQVFRDLKTERQNVKMLKKVIDFDSIDCNEDSFLPTMPQMLEIVEKAKTLTNFCTMEWPEGKALKVLGKIEPSSFNINVITKENWFEMEGNAYLPDGQQFSLDQIMAAIAAGGYSDGYLKLGEDEYAALSDSLVKYIKRLESAGQSQKGIERIPVFQAGLIAELLKKSGIKASTDTKYAKALKRMKEAEKMVPEVPDGLKTELRDYQLDGYRWMTRLSHWGAGACLADDMGLGKTIQTIAFLLYKASEGPSLVIAPASVLMNWQKEINRFAPSLNPVVFNDSDDRASTLESAADYDVILTTYGLLAKEHEALSKRKWNVACLDEAHTIKNKETKMSDAAMSLQAESRIILTGTPVQNYLGELWNLFQFINPGLLGTFEQFSTKFIIPIEQLNDNERKSQLKRIIQPFMLRRTKAEVIEELPEKTEITRLIDLTPAESVVYETMREDAKSKLETEGRVNVNALAAITLLREAACAMPIVRKNWKEEPSKITALTDLVGEIISGGNSVLIFSQFTGFLDIVSKTLKANNVSHLYLNGSTPLKRRQEMVNDFQHGKVQVFLISLKAGGLGLNLTGANYVIHLDPWWNPAIEQQATDRAYRIGQEQNVTVYHLIAKGTIEEKILRLHKKKQNLAESILEGTSQSHPITIEELKELLDK